MVKTSDEAHPSGKLGPYITHIHEGKLHKELIYEELLLDDARAGADIQVFRRIRVRDASH
jgi:hypothetical protein